MTVNPFDLQKQLFDQWEKNVASYLEKVMRQPEFMKLVAKNLETTLDLQSAIKKQVQGVLKTLAIPTEADLLGLYQTVNNVETRLLDLEEKADALSDIVDTLAAGPPAAASKASPSTQDPAKGPGARPSARKKKAAPKKAAPQRAAGRKKSGR